MACLKPDGTLTETGRAGLAALREYGTEEEAARASGLPIYRVRMLVRALVDEGLLEERGGRLAATQLGEAKLLLA